MKKIFFAFIFCLLYWQIKGQAGEITILHTNDLHSRLTGFSPEALYSPLTTDDDSTVGGFARIASVIKSVRESNPGSVLVIDGGDFLMGTLFHTLEEETGFHLQLMKKMGYDVTCLGNHEFDFGPETLADIITASAEGGETPAVLMGNIIFDSKDSRDDSLEQLYKGGHLKRTIVITRNGLKIGLFSLLGKNAYDVAPNAKPVSVSRQVSFARKMVKELEGKGCDLIICVSHSGLTEDETGVTGGEDFDLAGKVKGIDVIISGHTHTVLEKPLIVNDVPILQAGAYGQYVGSLTLDVSSGNVEVKDYLFIPVNDKIPGDEYVDKLIREQKDKIESRILKPIEMEWDDQIVESDFLLECDVNKDPAESNIGPMIADAIHFYVNNHCRSGTDISMVAAGVIRDNIVPGIQTTPDIFRIMSLGSGGDMLPGYPLSTLYVTGRELKNIMEILLVAYKSSPDSYCYYSGFRVEYDPDKMLLRKIQKIELVNEEGTVTDIDMSKKNRTLYSITASSYMLEFIGIIKKMSFGLINVIPKDIDGNKITDMKSAIIDIDESRNGIQEGKEWLALVEYLSSMKDKDGNGIPDIDDNYREVVKSLFIR